jgi:hypothetical protein
VFKFIKRWYQGEHYSISEPYPRIFPGDRYKRHWTSRFAHIFIEFYLKEWKWLLPFLVGLLGVVLAIIKML